MLLWRDQNIRTSLKTLKVKKNRENYKIQWNFCKKLLRKTKKSYFNTKNLNPTDNRIFWETIVPLFTKKAAKGEEIILNEAEKHISDDKEICAVFNNFFLNVVSDLKILNHCNYFPKKTHILPQLSLKRFKNTQVYLILKKESWFSFFIHKDFSRGNIEIYPGFKHKNYQIKFRYFLKYNLQTFWLFRIDKGKFHKWFETCWYWSSI